MKKISRRSSPANIGLPLCTLSFYHKSGVFAIPRNAYIFKVVQYIMLCKTSKIRGN